MKPNIMILGTGGTIAGAAPSTDQTAGYKSGSLGIEDILKSVPQLASVVNVKTEQVFNLSSRLMSPNEWLILARRTSDLAKRNDVDGIVVTHGTNTLEETSFFLQLTVQTRKPIVFVGAMRPATAISADGPMNILQAALVAGSPHSLGKGVLVVMNGRIFSARDVTKRNTTNLDTMTAPNSGQLGFVENGLVYYNCSIDKKHTFESEFNIEQINMLPKVDIVYNYAGCGGEAVDAFLSAGGKGIISAGLGDGAFTKGILDSLTNAARNGIVVVRSSRTGSGIVIRDGDEKDTENGFIVSHDLNPQKARILLMVALTKTFDILKFQKYFYNY